MSLKTQVSRNVLPKTHSGCCQKTHQRLSPKTTLSIGTIWRMPWNKKNNSVIKDTINQKMCYQKHIQGGTKKPIKGCHQKQPDVSYGECHIYIYIDKEYVVASEVDTEETLSPHI